MKNDIFLKEYNQLNNSQKEAVDTIYGPVMVVAGPGTGKTQIIGLRTANIIEKTGINPQNILITTFTEAGVVAIKKRLEHFLGSVGYKVNVSTIHSFCQEVIKTFPEKFLEFKANILLDDIDSLDVLKNILDEEISNGNIKILTTDYDRFYYLRDIKSRISTLKNEGIDFFQFEVAIKELEQKYIEELSNIDPKLKKYEKTKLDNQKHISKLFELNHIYNKFNKYLHNNGMYDFNDMINFVLDKFYSDEDMSYYYALKYQFIMLDEFQDTNNSQNKIIQKILQVENDSNFKNIMVVGDDDQSIYRFQGANIENMLDFASSFEDIKVIVLKNNYRSTQNILDLCTLSISHNTKRITNKIEGLKKELISSNKKYINSDNKVNSVFLESKEEEYIYLLKMIKEKIKYYNLEDIAIIVRNNKEVEFLSNYFIKNGINVISKLNTNILNNNYVLFIINFLKLLKNDNLREDLIIDILRNDILGLNQVDIFKINKYLYLKNYSSKIKITLLDIIFDIENLDINISSKDKFIGFKNLFNSLKEDLYTKNFIDFFDCFIQKIDILDYIDKNGNFDDLQDVFTLFNKIKSFIEFDKDFGLDNFLKKIELYFIYGYTVPRQNIKKEENGINILTAHASKGLEYDVVCVPSLYANNWESKRVVDLIKLPKNLAGFGLQNDLYDDREEEERRLFFVACSRAKKELFLSSPKKDSGKEILISSFLLEVKELTLELKIDFLDIDFSNFLKTTLKNSKDYIYKEQEISYIKEFLSNYKLSASDLNVFLEDPKLFLRNVIFKYPFIDNEATIFGKVYHRVLELFYLEYKKTGILKDFTYLEFTFRVLLERELLNKESFDKLLNKGFTGLKGFYENYKNIKRNILFLEYSFSSKNIVFDGVPLTGKIDKIELVNGLIDTINNQNNLSLGGQQSFFKEQVMIVDYKTGKPKTINEIKGIDKNGLKKPGEGKYFRQLMFYKLLCELDFEFISKYIISTLALDFVEGRDGVYKFVEVDISTDEFEDFKKELLNSWRKINDLDFWKSVI